MATFCCPSTVSCWRDRSSSSSPSSCSFHPRSLAPFSPLRTQPRRLPAVSCELDLAEATSSRSSPEQEHPAGSKIRVLGPLTVYHVPKQPTFDLGGHEGEIKEVLKVWKGKSISANLPYKVQFNLELDGKPVKFVAHLKDSEFEVIG